MMSDFAKIPVARAIFENGTIEHVVLPAAPRSRFPEAVYARYDATRHKGKLHCMDCDAKLHYSAGSKRVCGGLSGPDEHFKTNPHQEHSKACHYAVDHTHGRDDKDVDRERGYRIHLNLPSLFAVFNAAARPYRRDYQKKLSTEHPRLKGRQSLAVKSVSELVQKLMKNGDAERIRDSVVVHGSQILDWKDFFIRHEPFDRRHVRYHALVQRLLRMNQGARVPVLIEIATDNPADWKQNGNNGKIVTAPFYWRQSERGVEHIQSVLYIDPPMANKGGVETARALQRATEKPGVYLVLGMARVRTHGTNTGLVHTLNISIRDESQIEYINIREVRKKTAPPASAPSSAAPIPR